MIVDPGTGGVLSCVLETETTVRTQTQKQETEEQELSQINKSRQITRAENKSDPEGTMKERNNPRKNNPVEYSKNCKLHKSPITSVPIPETSQNIIFSSHEVTDMS